MICGIPFLKRNDLSEKEKVLSFLSVMGLIFAFIFSLPCWGSLLIRLKERTNKRYLGHGPLYEENPNNTPRQVKIDYGTRQISLN
mgnify:CR=1 FL=1